MSELSEKIKKAIKNAGLSQRELESRTGIPHSAIQRYASGNTDRVPIGRIEKIAKACDVTAESLLGWDEKIIQNHPTITEETTTFPVVGEIAAGFDKIAVESWDGETVEIPNNYLKGRNREEFIVLKVTGDSMYPLYQNGDKVLILKQSSLNCSGDVGAILYNDEFISLKKVEFVKGENWLRMVSINPNYPPTLVQDEALEHCRIVGIPKLLIREFE